MKSIWKNSWFFQWKDGSATSVPMDGSNEVEDMIDYVKTSN